MEKTKQMCKGCYNDMYNYSPFGGCWYFESAKIVKKVEVGTWEPPPYNRNRAKEVLNCYNRQGSSFLPLDDCRVQ